LRLLVRVLEGIAREGHTTYADILDAFKCRCARLRIAYTPALINAAVHRLERGGQSSLIAPVLRHRLPPDTLESQPPVINRAEAERLYIDLLLRHRRERAIA